jgi:hypothetical protein
VGSQTLDDLTAGFGTVIELVHPRRGVLVSTRFPGRRLMPFADSLLYEARYDDSSNVVLQILSVEIDSTPGAPESR